MCSLNSAVETIGGVGSVVTLGGGHHLPSWGWPVMCGRPWELGRRRAALGSYGHGGVVPGNVITNDNVLDRLVAEPGTGAGIKGASDTVNRHHAEVTSDWRGDSVQIEAEHPHDGVGKRHESYGRRK